MMCDLRTVKLYTVNVVFLMRKRVRFVTPIAKVSLSPFDVAASNTPVFNMYAECLFSYRSRFLLLGERSFFGPPTARPNFASHFLGVD